MFYGIPLIWKLIFFSPFWLSIGVAGADILVTACEKHVHVVPAWLFKLCIVLAVLLGPITFSVAGGIELLSNVKRVLAKSERR